MPIIDPGPLEPRLWKDLPSPPPAPPPHPAVDLTPYGKPALRKGRLPTGLGKPAAGFPQLHSFDDGKLILPYHPLTPYRGTFTKSVPAPNWPIVRYWSPQRSMSVPFLYAPLTAYDEFGVQNDESTGSVLPN